MKRGHLLNTRISTDDRAVLIAATATVGVQLVEFDPASLEDLTPELDVGIVGLPLTVGEEAVVNERVTALVARGIRVVSIWLRKTDAGIPKVISEVGSSLVTVTSSFLESALIGGEFVWELSSGERRPEQDLKRNNC